MTQVEAEKWGVDAGQRGAFVRFGVSKANYGAPFRECWFRRHEGGVLKPAVLERPKRPSRTKLKSVVRGGDDNW